MGRSSSDEFGLGKRESIMKPTLLMNDKNILKIASGWFHSLVLKKGGSKKRKFIIYFLFNFYFLFLFFILFVIILFNLLLLFFLINSSCCGNK